VRQDLNTLIRLSIIFLYFTYLNHAIVTYVCRTTVTAFFNIRVFKNHLIVQHSQDNKKSLNVRIQPVADLSVVNDNDSASRDVDVSTSNSFICEDEFIFDLDNAEGNFIDLKKQLQHETAKFASSFYNELSMNRKHVQTIVDTTRIFFKNVLFSYLKPNILNVFRNIDNTSLYKIEQIFNLFENPFA